MKTLVFLFALTLNMSTVQAACPKIVLPLSFYNEFSCILEAGEESTMSYGYSPNFSGGLEIIPIKVEGCEEGNLRFTWREVNDLGEPISGINAEWAMPAEAGHNYRLDVDVSSVSCPSVLINFAVSPRIYPVEVGESE